MKILLSIPPQGAEHSLASKDWQKTIQLLQSTATTAKDVTEFGLGCWLLHGEGALPFLGHALRATADPYLPCHVLFVESDTHWRTKAPTA